MCLNAQRSICLKEWWLNLPQRAEIGFIEHEGRRVDCDREKANLFNHKYCHPSYDSANLPYAALDTLDFAQIPVAPDRLYTKNDTAAACYVSNPRIHDDDILRNSKRKLNTPWTKEEIIRTLASLDPNKNHGFGMHSRLLMLALDGIFEFLHWMVNAFLRGQHCSNVFKVTQIKPVLKAGQT